jgi:hypothetical protein
LSFIDSQRTAAHVFAVQGLNGALCIGAWHFHKAEATRTTGFAIIDQRNRLDRAVLLKQLANLGVVCRKRQVTHIDLRHTIQSLLKSPECQ